MTRGLVFKSVLDLALLKDTENPSSLDGSLGSTLAWGDGDMWLEPGWTKTTFLIWWLKVVYISRGLRSRSRFWGTKFFPRLIDLSERLMIWIDHGITINLIQNWFDSDRDNWIVVCNYDTWMCSTVNTCTFWKNSVHRRWSEKSPWYGIK